MIKIPSKNVSKLDLSNQNLKDFPLEILELKNLKKLNLSGNQLSAVPKEIEKLNYLQVLDLSNNRINNFQAKICSLKNLKVLNLNNNLIKTIPKQIENLSGLTSFHIAGNIIRKIPDSFVNLTNLMELNLSKNLLEHFPLEVLKLKRLQNLWINNLPLETFSVNDLLKLESLKSLYCFGALQKNSVIDPKYQELAKIKGNSITQAKLISNLEILAKGKEESLESINPRKIFLSYSHDDIVWLERVKLHLKVLKYNDIDFETWDDTKMKGGEKWKIEIARSLEESGIAILLISTSFLASDFIRNNELPTLLKNAEDNGVKILPLIVRPSNFTNDKLAGFQSVNKPERPLSALPDHEWENELVNLTKVVSDYLIENNKVF